MVHIVDGVPYLQSLHGNVTVEGNTITVSGDSWYTHVVRFKLSGLR